MAFEILMPQLGLTMEEGTVTQWLKQEGDPVKAGEAVLEITTDKLTNEVTSEHDGVLLKIVAQEGEDIPVKGLLGYIGQAGEQVGDTAAPAPAAAPAQASAAPATPAAAPAAAPSGVRIRISPYARKLAAGMGVDYSHLTGSGPPAVSWPRTSLPLLRHRRQHLLRPQLHLPHLLPRRAVWS